jgi:YQGE family putative transporter
MTTDNEMTLGWFLRASSLIALVANYVLTKWLTLQRRELSIWIGTTMIGLVILPYFFWSNIWSLFVLGLGVAFFYPLYFAPLTSAVFDVIGEKNVMVSQRVEYIALKDIMLYLGRMVTVLFFAVWISVSTHLLHLRWYLLFVAFVQVLVCYCHRKMKVCP